MPDEPTGHPEGIEITDRHAAIGQPNRAARTFEWSPAWTDAEGQPTTSLTLQHAISAQAGATPEAIAIQTPTSRMTYGELDRWTDQLAHHLRWLGVLPEDMIALSFENSLDSIIGMLGTLKAGAGYLSLDPYLPAPVWQERLASCGCQMLLTTARLLPELPDVPVRKLCIDAAWDKIRTSAVPRSPAPIHPEQLACASYFCGSRPLNLAIQISQGALFEMARAGCATYDLGPSDRVLQVSPLEWVFAPAELFPAWLTGATLLTGVDWFCPLDTLLEFVVTQKVTVIHLPNDAWQELSHRLVDGDLQLPDCLRMVVVGEEAASPKQLQAWRQRFGEQVVLRTTYGTNGTSSREAGEPRQPALPDIRAYVLGTDLHPVARGQSGELFISGSGLGRSYFRDTRRTAEHFLPDPLSRDGARMYRTGHKARRLDGTVEFLATRQATMRGFRMDLGQGHAPYRAPTAVEAVILAPPHPDARAENELLERLQVYTGGCVRASMGAHETMAAEDVLRYLAEDRFSELEDGREIN